jgi:hypothetical protein
MIIEFTNCLNLAVPGFPFNVQGYKGINHSSLLPIFGQLQLSPNG